MRFWKLTITVFAFWLSTFTAVQADDASAVRLPSDIASLFKQHCIQCHGPAKQEGRLNMAVPPGIRRGGANGEVIAPGSLDRSRLWQMVANDEMPPESPLPDRAKETLRRWILAGAPGLPEHSSVKPAGDEHWAFQQLPEFAAAAEAKPLKTEPDSPDLTLTRLPVPRDISQIRTPIDRFIQQRLESVGLTLGPPADRETLLRRVSLDLTGLPPAPADRTAFLQDMKDGAYERMVDRYLDSARFGERWGKYWLDAAGYADSNGYFGADTDRPLAYRYRDYVIRSLNEDKPWDQFIREQLAGDEIAGYGTGVDIKQGMLPLLEAVHFLRNSPDGTDSSDGNPDEVRRDKYAALEGTIDILGASLLGMTVGCARCHDHKFEPFTQRDYYQLQAVIYPAFNVAAWIKPKQRQIQAASAEERLAWQTTTKRIDKSIADLQNEFRTWLRDHREPAETVFSDDFDSTEGRLTGTWTNTAPADKAPAGLPAVNLDSASAPAARVEDGRLQIIESGAAGDRVCCTVESFDWTPPEHDDWIQVTFDLEPQGTPAPYVGYFAALRDFNDARGLSGGNILIDGRRSGGAAIHVDYPGGDSVSRGTIGTTGYEPGQNLGIRITNVRDGKFEIAQIVDGLLEPGTVSLSTTDLPDGAFGFEYCCNRSFVVDNVLIERSLPSSGQRPGQNARTLTTDADPLRKLIQQKRDALHEQLQQLNQSRPAAPGQLAIVADYSTDVPTVPLLIRGEHKLPGESVPAAAPHVLGESNNPIDLDRTAEQLSGKLNSTGRRLAFARWLTQRSSRAAGLLARVTVNRWWQYHFGRGIVATPENLGYSGAAPTHPELLNFLAAHLVKDNWSAKAMHRLILRSAVYRQQSTFTQRTRAADLDNRLWSRYSMRRLDAEAIRDGMLAVSGQLNNLMFGSYVPTEHSSDGRVVLKSNTDGRLRRSIYLQQRRTQTLDMLRVFDAPSIVAACTGRPRTTVPLQSLNLLNSPFIRDRAAALANRINTTGPITDGDFVHSTFLLTIGRKPRPTELETSITFLTKQPTEYGNAPDSLHRARVDFCQMLLASNAFLYVE
jgi:hypothetical protein